MKLSLYRIPAFVLGCLAICGDNLFQDRTLRFHFCFLLSALCFLPVHAATVTGDLLDIGLQPLNTKLIFTPTNEVLISTSGLSIGPPKILDTANGSFSITLDAGFYTVALPAIPYRRPFLITVPATNGTVNITNLISQLPYLSTNCLVKTTPWDTVPAVLKQKLDVMGSLTKLLVTNFSSGAVTLFLSNNPAAPGGGGGGSTTALALTNANIQIGLDGTCTFGVQGVPFTIDAGGNFSRLPVGDEGQHLLSGDGSFSLCNSAFTADGSGNLQANSLNLAEDLEISDTARGLIIKSPGGIRYRLKVADDGTLSTEVVP